MKAKPTPVTAASDIVIMDNPMTSPNTLQVNTESIAISKIIPSATR